MKKLEMGDAEQAAFVRITKKINLFSSELSTGFMEKIIQCVSLYEFKPGEKVCRQGDPGDAFYAVLSGKLAVSAREAFVLSKSLAELKDGDIFGEMALLERAPRSATVSCLTQSRLFVLLREDFQAILRVNPEFKEEIKNIASRRFLESGAGG